MTVRRLNESTSLAEAVTGTPGRRFRARLIAGDIWGSSGYYSREVIERDGPNVWPEGTQMYFNHPSRAEDRDRPERSVLDLAGRVASTPVYETDGLYADIEVYEDAAPFVTARAADLGLSIRASAEVEMGEKDGRRGYVITRLIEGQSVDFVTRAGAGGAIVGILESARPSQVVERAVARSHDVTEASARDMRQRLDQLLQEAYGAEESWVWVRDFDPDVRVVWYEHETAESAAIFEHPYAIAESGDMSLSGAPVEVRVETRYVPVAPAADTPTEESRRTPMPQIEEACLRQLETDAGRVPTLESERDAERQRRETTEAENRLLRAQNAARPVVQRVLAESRTLPAITQARVVEQLLAAPPVNDQGALDEAALTTAAEAARTAAETELAEALATAGYGKPRGLGNTDAPDTSDVTEAQANAAVAAAFGRPVKEA